MRISSFVRNSILVSTFVSTLAIVSPFAMADDSAAVRTIAGILAELNSAPSDAAKSQLMAIENDAATSIDFRIIARAVHDLNQTVASDYRDELTDIVSDNNADPAARELAQIVMNLDQTADEATKSRLQALR